MSEVVSAEIDNFERLINAKTLGQDKSAFDADGISLQKHGLKFAALSRQEPNETMVSVVALPCGTAHFNAQIDEAHLSQWHLEFGEHVEHDWKRGIRDLASFDLEQVDAFEGSEHAHKCIDGGLLERVLKLNELNAFEPLRVGEASGQDQNQLLVDDGAIIELEILDFVLDRL